MCELPTLSPDLQVNMKLIARCGRHPDGGCHFFISLLNVVCFLTTYYGVFKIQKSQICKVNEELVPHIGTYDRVLVVFC